MSFEEAEILRKRAEGFLRNAKRLIEEKEWDLAMFNLEQYCQLIMKYRLLVLRGSYPRTHSLRRLIRELGSFTRRFWSLSKILSIFITLRDSKKPIYSLEISPICL